MSRISPIELSNICILRDGDKLLVEDKVGKGIVFPGGHVERGESMQQSVIREMREETGLTIEHPVLCGIKDWEQEDGSRYLVAIYRAERFSGELCASAEGRVFWVTREEFDRMNVIWGMRDILRVSESADLSEMYWDEDKQGWVLLG